MNILIIILLLMFVILLKTNVHAINIDLIYPIDGNFWILGTTLNLHTETMTSTNEKY
jgi:hypothetical protein